MNTSNGDLCEEKGHLRGAAFSACGRYRYKLERRWDESLPTVMFIMLNPSTADAEYDDPALERCRSFAKSWGYGGLLIGNLFAWRATFPRDLKDAGKHGKNLVGPLNNAALRDMAAASELMVAAWGNDGSLQGLSLAVQRMFAGRLHYIRLNKTGEPAHPLYLPGDLTPVWLPFRHLFRSADDC